MDAIVTDTATAVDEAIADQTDMAAMVMPGTIDQTSSIDFHTKAGMNLLYGLKLKTRQGSRGAPGLFTFAYGTNMLINYSHQDDPYADRQLLRVERHLETVAHCVPPIEEWLVEMLSGSGGASVPVDVHGSKSPVSKEFRFANPYSWRALDYVVQADRIMQCTLCAMRVGRLERNERDDRVYSCFTAIRKLFEAGTGYEYSGINREDYVNATDLAMKIVSRRGDLDPAVLNRETVPKMRPPYAIRFSS